MNKRLKVCLLFLIVAVIVSMALAPTDAFAVSYGTWTLGPGNQLVSTQTAYEAKQTLAVGLKSPEDMRVFDNKLYVADTGNKVVKVFDKTGLLLNTIGETVLKFPSGIFVSQQYIYVADKELKAVVIFDRQTGKLLTTLTKPKNVLLGDNAPYVPLKVTVDARENIYIVSEGSVKGIIQIIPLKDAAGKFNGQSEFLGFVGANKTEMTFDNILKSLFFPDDEKSGLFLAAPRSPTFLTINKDGLIYTVTTGATTQTVKKLNTVGNIIMSPNYTFPSTVAIELDSDDNIFAVDSNGYISVFDGFGELLFVFGGGDSAERLGNLKSPVAISVEGNELYVLDKTYQTIVKFERTQFANTVLDAVNYFKDGLYIEGETLWQELLQMNSSFILSYKALAMSNLKKGNYEQALKQFEMAEDKQGYSEAYWQIRNNWLQKNLGWVIVALVTAIAAVSIVKLIQKKTRVFTPVVEKFKLVSNLKYVKQLSYVKRFSTKTGDAVYEIKTRNAVGALSATILYVWFAVLQILSVVCSGFLFSSATIINTNLANLLLYSIVPLLLFVACNYLVSTVSNGEGKFREVYITTIYSLSPYLLMALPIFVITNFLTFNEMIVYQALTAFMYAWCVLLIFRNIMELHDYTLWQTIKNILLTIFTLLMVVLFTYVIFMLCSQLFGYIASIFVEVFS